MRIIIKGFEIGCAAGTAVFGFVLVSAVLKTGIDILSVKLKEKVAEMKEKESEKVVHFSKEEDK